MPWSLGGGPDTIARQVASYGEKYLGVPVIVENHTGGSGTIAMNDALQAEDDGYTMVVANGPLFSLTPSFINVNYTLDDITPLIGMRITEFVVLTNSKSGITNIDELKRLCRQRGTQSSTHTQRPWQRQLYYDSVLSSYWTSPLSLFPTTAARRAINALVGGQLTLAIGSPPTYRRLCEQRRIELPGNLHSRGAGRGSIGHISSFRDQGVDVDFTGMDYFAVRSSVDDSKKEVLTNFIAEVYADPEFPGIYERHGHGSWEATESEIVDM